MPHNAHKAMLISRCKREKHMWTKVDELAQLCDTKVFVCIEHDLGPDKYKPKFVYYLHPDSDFPLSWTEMRTRGYPKPDLRTPATEGPVKMLWWSESKDKRRGDNSKIGYLQLDELKRVDLRRHDHPKLDDDGLDEDELDADELDGDLQDELGGNLEDELVDAELDCIDHDSDEFQRR